MNPQDYGEEMSAPMELLETDVYVNLPWSRLMSMPLDDPERYDLGWCFNNN